MIHHEQLPSKMVIGIIRPGALLRPPMDDVVIHGTAYGGQRQHRPPKKNQPHQRCAIIADGNKMQDRKDGRRQM